MLILGVEGAQELLTEYHEPAKTEVHDDTPRIYKELVDQLDLYGVANEFVVHFVGSSEHRLRLLGTFTV